MNIDKATELEFALASQREMLKKCREIMRNKGMGQSYPISTGDFRKELRKFARIDEESGVIDPLNDAYNISLLCEFIEEQGITPKELERFLRKKNETH